MFLKRKYLDIKSFNYRSGSAFKCFFVVYEIDFISGKLIKYEESNYQKNNEKVYLLNNELVDELKNDLFNTGYYKLDNCYVNKRIKDGHQWKLCVRYDNGELNSFGSNMYPNNIKSFFDYIEKLDNLLKEV